MIYNHAKLYQIYFVFHDPRISAKPGAEQKHVNGINKAACNDAICHFSGRLCQETQGHKQRAQRPVYKAVVAASCSFLLEFVALFLPVFEVFVDP